MTTSNKVFATFLPVAREYIELAKLSLDKFESKLGDGAVDEAALGELARALHVAALSVKQTHALTVSPEDFCHVRGLAPNLLQSAD